jgi:FkbM family methyltransferase
MKKCLVSYSQFDEDLILFNALNDIDKVFWIDVGANDPVHLSVTKLFYDRGGRGINIEPQPFYSDDYKILRPRDINLQVGVSDVSGVLPLYGEGVEASFIKSECNSKVNGNIPIKRLDDILDELIGDDNSQIHFLKIDVEDLEEQVLKGMNFKKYRPWIILIEAHNHDWEELITTNNYDFVMSDDVNRYYVSNEHSNMISRMKKYEKLYEDYYVIKAGGSAEIDMYKRQVRDLRNSVSYRITKPIRVISGLVIRTINIVKSRRNVKC